MSGEIISLDDFRKTAKDMDDPVVTNPMEGFSPETQSDAMANEIMMGVQKKLIKEGICPMVDVNDELLTAMYDLTRAITDRHFDVYNELIATRNIQAEHGEPFFLTDVFVKNHEDEESEPETPISLVCNECGHEHTIYHMIWDAIACKECGHEIQNPDKVKNKIVF